MECVLGHASLNFWISGLIGAHMVLISDYWKKRICRFDAGYVEQELSAKGGVLLDQESVIRPERAIIIQNLLGYFLLPEIVAETGHGDCVDHFVGHPERPRQGRREDTDIEGVSKGVAVKVLELSDGFEKLSADGQAGHNRAHDLAGSDKPFGLFGFEVRQDSLSFSKKSQVSRNGASQDGLGGGPFLQIQRTGDDFRTLVGSPVFGNNIIDPGGQIAYARIRLDLNTLKSKLLEGLKKGTKGVGMGSILRSSTIASFPRKVILTDRPHSVSF